MRNVGTVANTIGITHNVYYVKYVMDEAERNAGRNLLNSSTIVVRSNHG